MQILKGSVARVATLRKWMRHFQVLAGAALITALVAAPTDAFSQQTNASRFKALPDHFVTPKAAAPDPA